MYTEISDKFPKRYLEALRHVSIDIIMTLDLALFMKFKTVSVSQAFRNWFEKKDLKWPIGRSWVQVLTVLISVGIFKIEDFLSFVFLFSFFFFFFCFLRIVLYRFFSNAIFYIYTGFEREIEHLQIIQNGGSKIADGLRSFSLHSNRFCTSSPRKLLPL